MKKSVMLVIAAIYVLSIILVGFIGIRMKVYNQIKYVEEIKVVDTSSYKFHQYSSEQKAQFELDGYYSIKYQEGLRVPLKFEVSPVDATDHSLKFIYDTNPDWKVTENKDGTLYVDFYDTGSVIITVQANDGKGCTIRIRIDVHDF